MSHLTVINIFLMATHFVKDFKGPMTNNTPKMKICTIACPNISNQSQSVVPNSLQIKWLSRFKEAFVVGRGSAGTSLRTTSASNQCCAAHSPPTPKGPKRTNQLTQTWLGIVGPKNWLSMIVKKRQISLFVSQVGANTSATHPRTSQHKGNFVGHFGGPMARAKRFPTFAQFLSCCFFKAAKVRAVCLSLSSYQFYLWHLL